MLKLSGFEKRQWDVESDNNTSTYKGSNVIIESDSLLFKFQDSAAYPGQYSFPFSLKLPDWLPASFIFYGLNASEIKVKYDLIAYMPDALDPKTRPFKPFLVKKRLILRKSISSKIFNKTISLQNEIKTMFFVSQGQAKADVTFEKDAYN
jgi:hypothetical protein